MEEKPQWGAILILKIKNMQLRKTERKKAKIKMALQGASGSGKTYSSLLLAKGLCNGNFDKVAIIDTENGSADLYAHLGNYQVISLKPPFTPELYIQALHICEQAGIEVVIIDSMTHCWEELLDFHSKLAGNSFTNWAKVTPRHKSLIDKILQLDAHVIATIRTKQDFVLNQKDGKFVPEKVGLKAVQRDGIDYEFTLVFDIDIKHFATSSKDRTGLFISKPEFVISEHTGKKILEWCNMGTSVEEEDNMNLTASKVSNSNLTSEISSCNSLAELLVLYKKQDTQQQEAYRSDFEFKKNQLFAITNPQNISNYGNQPQ